MDGVVIRKGGLLAYTHWIYDESIEEGGYRSRDVTSDAHAFLFELCRLEKCVTLADILAIVRHNETLQNVFRRDWANELVREAFTGEIAPAPVGYSPDTIEYLEIYQIWAFNSRTSTYEPNTRPDFHGVGVELREDHYEGGSLVGHAGTRIHWGLSFMSPCELMNLSVRINPVVQITEEDTDADNYAQAIGNVRYELLTLYQVLHAIFWELSWHGPAKDREARRREIMGAAREAREHPERLIEFDDDELKGRIFGKD